MVRWKRDLFLYYRSCSSCFGRLLAKFDHGEVVVAIDRPVTLRAVVSSGKNAGTAPIAQCDHFIHPLFWVESRPGRISNWNASQTRVGRRIPTTGRPATPGTTGCGRGRAWRAVPSGWSWKRSPTSWFLLAGRSSGQVRRRAAVHAGCTTLGHGWYNPAAAGWCTGRDRCRAGRVVPLLPAVSAPI